MLFSGILESESEIRLAMSDPLWPHGLYSPWNSPGPNTGVGTLSLLQGISPIQGWNPGLLHCRWTLYQLSHKESLVLTIKIVTCFLLLLKKICVFQLRKYVVVLITHASCGWWLPRALSSETGARFSDKDPCCRLWWPRIDVLVSVNSRH